MVAHTPVPYITEADYLAIEMNSQERHEYIDGSIFAMTGASREKLLAYQSIPSVQEYCLVAQDHYSVKKYTRDKQQGWYVDDYSQ